MCFTPGKLLENIPESCQHCVTYYFSQAHFCPWTSFINFVFHTSTQISHMKSRRVNKDTEQLNTMSPEVLHMTATELLLYDRRNCHADRTCTPLPHHLNFQKVVSNVSISSYCFRKEDCPDYSCCTDSTPRSISVSYNGTSCITLELHAKLSCRYMHFRKILCWEFLRNVVYIFHF
jgi:hypothetical protein